MINLKELTKTIGEVVYKAKPLSFLNLIDISEKETTKDKIVEKIKNTIIDPVINEEYLESLSIEDGFALLKFVNEVNNEDKTMDFTKAKQEKTIGE